MLKKEAVDIIDAAARDNRTTWKQLTLGERRLLSAYYLYDADQGLADADDEHRLQDVVAKWLLTDSINDMYDLLDTLTAVYVTGDDNYPPHFADAIETALCERRDALYNKPNENFENDSMQRAHDCRCEQRRQRGIY